MVQLFEIEKGSSEGKMHYRSRLRRRKQCIREIVGVYAQNAENMDGLLRIPDESMSNNHDSQGVR